MGGPRYRYDLHRNSDSIWQALPHACWLLAYIEEEEEEEEERVEEEAGLIKSVLANEV